MDTNVTPDPSSSTEQQNASAIPETLDANGQRSSQHHAGQLSPLLVWAVVFCDIGTFVYYVPGILYAQVGALTPLFIAATIIGFIPLALKYQEICWRNPEGCSWRRSILSGFEKVRSCRLSWPLPHSLLIWLSLV